MSSGKRDASADDMAYAVRLANRAFSAEQIFRALSAKPSGRREPGSLKYQRLLDGRGRDRADAYAWTTAEKAIAFVQANPAITDRPSALVKLLELEAVAGALPWAVYGGASARRALEAAFVVAERVGGLSFGLSVREHAELTGHDFERIRVDRRVLTDLGWLRRDPSDRLGRTSRFSLRRGFHIHSHQGDLNVGTDREWLAHDGFRDRALGDLGWLVLSLLAAPVSTHALALRTGLDQTALEDVCSKLERAGLMRIVDDDLIHRANDVVSALDHAARDLGTIGAGDADRERHRVDREAFRARQDVNVEVAAR